MLENGASAATAVAGMNFDSLLCNAVEYIHSDNMVPEGKLDRSSLSQNPCDGGEPPLEDFLELSGVTRIADAAWLCCIGNDGELIRIIAHTGILEVSEIADVLESLKGPINLGRAMEPFRWLCGGCEYIVCVVGSASPEHTALILRADRLEVADWPQVQRMAARAQRLISLGLSIGGASGKPAIADGDTQLAVGILNLYPFGIIVLDADHNVLLANMAMTAFLAGTPLLSTAGGKFAIFNSDDAVRFHVALRAVLAATKPADAQHVVALDNENGRPILLTITKVSGRSGHSCACVMVTDTGCDYLLNIQPLATAFALTPVETRLVLELAEGRSVKEAAQRLKLKVETARTYLKQIFQKTDTRRQLDLVQLMRGGALPMLARNGF